jgi:ComF family protein
MPYLATGAGAYMAGQFLRLEWSMPDYIIPVPITRMHKWERGYNQSLLLAESMANLLSRPVLEALSRSSGDYSQAGLSRKQREQLQGQAFRLSVDISLENKNLLLVDDVMTTGTTMHRCTETLLTACPASVYGLAFCRAAG